VSEELIELGRACRKGQIVRRSFTTKRGKRVPPACVKDAGAPGKTPKSKRVLPVPEPGFLKGWRKVLPDKKRHKIIKDVNAAEGCASTIRRLNLLANYTKRTSPETYRKARADMAWVRRQGFCKLKSKA
jgi:hypothetical protein